MASTSASPPTPLQSLSFTTPWDEPSSYLAAGPESGRLIIFCHGWPAIAKTWESQLIAFAELGYRVVAPDMPGYNSLASPSRDTERYSLENVNRFMMALLVACGRKEAAWVGHDWGAVAVWSFAAHHPSATTAAIGLARPSHTLEYGLPGVLPTINRTIYPTTTHPYGQYSYQVYFQRSFAAATAWFDASPSLVLRAIYRRGSPSEVGKPSPTSTVLEDNGWLGGIVSPPESLAQIPTAALCVSEELLGSIVQRMEKNGFWAPNAWYANHEANERYARTAAEGGRLRMPVLFVGARWDPISDVEVSGIAEAMRVNCEDLREVRLDAGHWVGLEKGEEVNGVIGEWLREKGL